MTLKDKLEALARTIQNTRAGALLMESKDPKGWTWEAVMKSVRQTEAALRDVRTAVRARERKDRRAACDHPEKSRSQFGRCNACGLTKLDPAPALVLCECGHRRYQHNTGGREICQHYHDGTGRPDCEGFKPEVHLG